MHRGACRVRCRRPQYAVWRSARTPAGVMVDQSREQPKELATVRGGERRDKRLLRGLDSPVESFQCPSAGWRQVDENAPLVLLVADARHQAIAFELTQQCMHVTAINR